jgi:hypothetical protein
LPVLVAQVFNLWHLRRCRGLETRATNFPEAVMHPKPVHWLTG